MTSFVYTTMAGDTFDILALDAYNDEALAGEIIRANPQYAGVLIFPAGVQLMIPVIETPQTASLAPWRR